MKTKHLVSKLLSKLLLGSSIILASAGSAFAVQGSVALNCQMELGSDFSRLTLRGRVSYDKVIQANINIPISSSVEDNHIILEDEDINSYFHQRIVFLGNALIDPVTGERKIFIGMYAGYPNTLRGRSNFFNLPFIDFYQDYNGNTVQDSGFGIPIVSAASDSGSISLFTGDFKQARLKMNCKTSDSESYVSKLDFNQPRHQFSCNINMRNGHSGRQIDEINKQVILGFNVNDRMELQPIIEDEHLKSVLASAHIMGNLYLNPETSKPELLLGIYRMSRWYDPEKHSEYFTPERQARTHDGRPFFYAMPLAEVRTNSDYAELRTGATLSGYSLKVECKKIENRITWLE